MKRSLIIPLLILVFMQIGCASHQGVILQDGKAYLQLSGLCKGVSLQIDDNDPIAVVGACGESTFSVAPGRHILKLYRDGVLILERLMFFTSNETSEVTLP